ncbi:ABC transporter ATP-binding protein [uncultured Methanoregula sp.]|uniref:ABC transporter ATP-binding protein n=1 Tax=uncultured Methanoregula sp. TaxID=1005933 RepID=UPI002AAAEBC6|nr:ABC transporter ATP-binding protein [uncultured Methanoregula sp.]
MMDPILSLDTITKTFRDDKEACPALAGISFDVDTNEILCIMGPSGCGKTTLLRIIGGLEQEDSGTIREASGITPGKSLTAMVFQDHALFPWLSIYENIVYGLRLEAQKVPEDVVKERAEALLSLTHLDTFMNSFPHQLSGGMKQRVAVARALAVKPDILLMDEPFSALDTFTRRELEDEVLRIRQAMKTTILLVTHNPEEAVYLADRIVILSKRPAGVSEILPVNLPHPRDPSNPEFIKIREQVTRRVQGKPDPALQ